MPRATKRNWAPLTYGAASVVFAGALGGIVAQVQAGEDPALGAPVAESAIPQPHYVITRRVERTKVIVRRVRDLPPLPPKVVAAAPAVGTGGGYASAPTYVAPAASSGSSGGSSAPAPAPAPVAAPAPAPAASVPAPVTRAS